MIEHFKKGYGSNQLSCKHFSVREVFDVAYDPHHLGFEEREFTSCFEILFEVGWGAWTGAAFVQVWVVRLGSEVDGH